MFGGSSLSSGPSLLNLEFHSTKKRPAGATLSVSFMGGLRRTEGCSLFTLQSLENAVGPVGKKNRRRKGGRGELRNVKMIIRRSVETRKPR